MHSPSAVVHNNNNLLPGADAQCTSTALTLRTGAERKLARLPLASRNCGCFLKTGLTITSHDCRWLLTNKAVRVHRCGLPPKRSPTKCWKASILMCTFFFPTDLTTGSCQCEHHYQLSAVEGDDSFTGNWLISDASDKSVNGHATAWSVYRDCILPRLVSLQRKGGRPLQRTWSPLSATTHSRN